MRYPLGEQNFDKIIEGGFTYVDKSGFIPLLLKNNYYFLSRPRRFGKSLLISMLEQFFLGRRELFKGLKVYELNWNWETFPVIRIDLSNGSFSNPEGLTNRLNRIIADIESKYDIKSDGILPGEKFDSSIKLLRSKFDRKVVILIDEYEKPLLDTFDLEHQLRYRNELRDFYSVLKENTVNIEFLFITGVTKFGHLNVFSGLNNLTDISLDDRFASICGITSEEMRDYFTPGIQELAEVKGLSFEDTIEKMKNFYDGYHFSGSLTDVYNPFSLLHCLYSKRFTSSWFLSGSPSFLINILQKNNFNLTELEGVTASEQVLLGLDASFEDSITLLYQSGYLTIKAYDGNSETYSLGIPNIEVKKALYEVIVPHYLGKEISINNSDYSRISKWLNNGNIQDVVKWLQEFFTRVSYNVKLLPLGNHLKQESDFQFIVYAIIALSCGVNNVELEQATSFGRLDLYAQTNDYIYIFEFKMGDDATEALQQIEKKGYALRWSADERHIIEVGIAFSPASRTISDYAVKALK